MRIPCESNLAHRSPLPSACFVATNRPSLLRELRPRCTPILCLSYFQCFLLLHFLVLLAELGQIEFHYVLDQVVQLVLVMLKLCDIDYILFLQIG